MDQLFVDARSWHVPADRLLIELAARLPGFFSKLFGEGFGLETNGFEQTVQTQV